jgi:hypothetical protein
MSRRCRKEAGRCPPVIDAHRQLTTTSGSTWEGPRTCGAPLLPAGEAPGPSGRPAAGRCPDHDQGRSASPRHQLRQPTAPDQARMTLSPSGPPYV